jgi:hypothetical protein
MLLLVLRPALAAAEARVVAVMPAQPLELREALEAESRVWVRPGPMEVVGGIAVRVRHIDSVPASEPAVFEAEVHAGENARDSVVVLEIFNAVDDIVARGEAKLDLVKGINHSNFAWHPQYLADGVYTAHFYVWHPMRGRASYRNLILIKISPSLLHRELSSARESLGNLGAHITPHLRGPGVSVLGVRFALATDYMGVAEGFGERGAWPHAVHVARYVQATVHSIRAYLTFAPHVEELLEPIPQPDMAGLRIVDGTFYAGQRPVFLFGWNRALDVPTELGHLRRYGLNAAVLTATPEVVLAGPAGTAALDAAFAEAHAHNLAVTVVAPIGDAAPWEPFELSEAAEQLHPVQFVAAHLPDRRGQIEQYLRALLPSLEDRPHLVSLSLADKPAFRMDGPEVKAALAGYVRALYPDRLTVNRAWQTRFSEFSEIDVWWESQSTAYQYDWQTFQFALGRRFFEQLVLLARSRLPDTPLQLRYADNIFLPGETRLGIEHEALRNLFQISGCAVATHADDPVYALGYPHTAMTYAFLRSIAPEQPIYNTQQRLWSDAHPHVDYSFDYVHSVMWDGAIEGQDGSAIVHALPPTRPDFDQHIYERPESFEGYVTAALNINRLAELVAAFQGAPADVAVLISLPSRILNDGLPYMASLAAAFEGASLSGRKVNFITEQQIRHGGLEHIEVLIIPNMTAISQGAFDAVNAYIARSGIVIRAGTILPYDQWGHSRRDIINRSLETIYLTESAHAAQFYHAMDAADSKPGARPVPHIVNDFGYPLEGMKSRFVRIDGVPHLYLLNLRQAPDLAHLRGPYRSGRDLIGARDVQFPMMVKPLDPMLIRLDPPELEAVPDQIALTEALPTTADGTPIIPVTPVSPLLPGEALR